MKHKEPIALLLIGAILSGLVTVGAAEAGTAADPLISLDWLRSTFLPSALTRAEEEIDQQLAPGASSQSQQGEDIRVKKGDVIKLENGGTVTLLAGSATIASASGGAVINVTVGESVSSGSALAPDHRYMAADKEAASITVKSDTAVLLLLGTYQTAPSKELDYNAMAGTLKELGLFRGTDTPYGSGFDLEAVPTRIQGLIMFLRLLGEETAAEAYPTVPQSGVTFTDVPDWALRYVAYAYDKGYTKGQALDEQRRVTFGTQDPLAARDYMTFLLRALGHKEGSAFQWLSAIEDATSLGVISPEQMKPVTDARQFLRSHVVYLSYRALTAKTAGGESTLLERLGSSGTIDVDKAKALVVR